LVSALALALALASAPVHRFWITEC
jgi:hypothetical protein